MRYHWGLEIGHIHAHKTTHETTDPQTVEGSENWDDPAIINTDSEHQHREHSENDETQGNFLGTPQTQLNDSDASYSSDSEVDLEDRQMEGWDSDENATDGVVGETMMM